MLQPPLDETGKTLFPHLLSPLTIGKKQVRNRILISAHVPGFAENNKPGDQYIAYHRNYAKNGAGLQITGATPIHTYGLLGTTSDAFWNLDDSIVPGYHALSGKADVFIIASGSGERGCVTPRTEEIAISEATLLANKI